MAAGVSVALELFEGKVTRTALRCDETVTATDKA